MKAQTYFLLVAVLAISSAGNVADGARIVGGSLTTIDAYPFVVQVRENNVWICGGSLITTQHVLTAAHCVPDLTPAQVSIKAGSSYVSTGGTVVQTIGVWPHPAYNPVTLEKDVAVLKLVAPISGTNIVPIPLATTNMEGGDLVQVLGWGDTLEDGSPSNQLRVVELPMITYAACLAIYGDRLFGSMICANKAGKDSCQGDSGGPLVKDGKVAGIVSWGDGCAQPGKPGVYTSVMRMKSFIEAKTAL